MQEKQWDCQDISVDVSEYVGRTNVMIHLPTSTMSMAQNNIVKTTLLHLSVGAGKPVYMEKIECFKLNRTTYLSSITYIYHASTEQTVYIVRVSSQTKRQ